MKAKIAVCASGLGSNFASIVQASREGRLAADIVGLIANRPAIGALDKAKNLQIPAVTLAPQQFASRELWDSAMCSQLGDWGADWVVLAGFLTLIGTQVLLHYPQKVVNIHPALLPKFGGRGMYGDHVHRAVLAAGEAWTGVTIHLVDHIYDRGRIVAQENVRVENADTVETLARRVKAIEGSFYPKVLNDLVTGRITTS